MVRAAERDEAAPTSPSGPYTDLGLTLPIFVAYHLGVMALPVRNAADMVTAELTALADNDLLSYAGLTLTIGVAFVGTLVVLGRGHTLRLERFAMIALEGVLYAIAMRLIAGYVVGRVFLVPAQVESKFAGVVMSLGAGFYEEIVFRVFLFGLGAKLLKVLAPTAIPFRSLAVTIGWAVVAAGVFSAWHYVGDLGDPFEARSFVFRWVCGLVFTAIYVFRGFAPVVWTHALYDVWVMAL
jgi:hypothetical protein